MRIMIRLWGALFILSCSFLFSQVKFPVKYPPFRWNIIEIYDNPTDRISLELQWASIYTYGDDYKIIGDLADEIGITRNLETEIHIRLKPDYLLLWSDSTKIDEEDFKTTFEYYAALSLSRKSRNRIKQSTLYDEFGSRYENCTYNENNNTLIIRMKEPMKWKHENIFEHIYIFPSEYMKTAQTLQKTDQNFVRSPKTSGPYILKKQEISKKYIFKRNRFYNQFRRMENSAALIDSIVWQVDANQNTWLNRLQIGEYSFIDQVPLAQVSELQNMQEVNYRIVPRNQMDILLINFNSNTLSGDLLRQLDFRKALAHCINKENFIESIFRSERFASQISGPFPPQYPAYNSDVTDYQFSIEEARDKLSRIGLVRSPGEKYITYMGEPIKIVFLHPTEGIGQTSSISQQFANTFRNELLDLGIQFEDVAVNQLTFEDRLLNGDFDIAYLDLSFANIIPIDKFFFEDGQLNYGGYKNHNIERQIQIFMDASRSSDEILNAGRQIHVLVHDQLPWIPLWSRMQITAWDRNKINNYKIVATDIFRFVEYWTKK